MDCGPAESVHARFEAFQLHAVWWSAGIVLHWSTRATWHYNQVPDIRKVQHKYHQHGGKPISKVSWIVPRITPCALDAPLF